MQWKSRSARLAASSLASLLLLAAPSTARAGSCDSAATVASDVWATYRKAVETLGCKTPLGGALEYGLCSATRLVNETMEDAVGWWNSGAQNRWPTIGPRVLGAEIEYGTVIAPTKRTFVSLVPSFNDGKIIVRGKEGTGVVTICAIDQAGKQYKLFNDVEVKGDRTFDISRKDAEGRILSVVIESRPVSFKYEVQKTEVPVEWNYGPIKGLADLHVHMAADLGFAGLWLRGSHDGPQNEALKSCRPLDLRDGVSLAIQLKGLPVIEKQKLHAIPLNWHHDEDEEVVLHGNGSAEGADSLKNWPHFSDIAHQQAHSDWLLEAHRKGLQLVVLSAVNNELLCRTLRAGLYEGDNKYACDDMSNLHRQLDAFNTLDQRHDWMEIALTPWHARRIIHEGKLAVVLSAESSHMMPPSEGDFKAQLDRMYQKGLRALQIVHERDDRFSGAAPHRPNFWWHQRTSNPFAWVTTTDDGSPFALDANGKNSRGLSGEGEQLIDAMVQRRMLIDVSHYSERAIVDLYKLVTTKYGNYPFHASHSRFQARLEKPERDLLKEFLTTDDQIAKIKAVGGMVGIRTGPTHTATDPASGVANDCPGSSKSYAQLVSYAKTQGLTVAFGSDFNGVTQEISPRVGDEGCYAARNAKRGVEAWNKDQRTVPGAVARFETQGLRHM
ncbi:MAG TPA: membrane dipeptidase, partial [Myxococcaceae bacterium]